MLEDYISRDASTTKQWLNNVQRTQQQALQQAIEHKQSEWRQRVRAEREQRRKELSRMVDGAEAGRSGSASGSRVGTWLFLSLATAVRIVFFLFF